MYHLESLRNRRSLRQVRTAFACLAVLAGGATPAWADLVTPAGVTATSFWDNSVHPRNLIDGSGLSAEDASASHSEGFGAIWHAAEGFGTAAGPGIVADQSLTFTLPGAYNLTGAHIWQMSQPLPFGADRGVNQYSLLVSSDGVNYTPAISSGNLAIYPGGGVLAESPTFAQQSNVRFVKLQIESAHSGAFAEFVGLSEVRFEGTRVSQGPFLVSNAATTASWLPQQPTSDSLLHGAVAASSIESFSTAEGVDALTNGIGDANLAHQVVPSDTSDPWQLTYSAAAIGLAAGETMNINKINVFAYNADGRRFTDFDVQYTTDGVNWEYLFIGAANALVSGGNLTLSSLARTDSEDLVTGARGLRFDFRPIGPGEAHSALVEIDVLGAIVGSPVVSGDFDGDGDVDGADFVAWQTHFPTATGATLADGDADGDGDVDGADFVVWQTNFPFTPSPGVSPVPEPLPLVLMLGGMATLACGRLWRRGTGGARS